MEDLIFEPSSIRQERIYELEQFRVEELAEMVYALENPDKLSTKEAIWKIRDMFAVYNFVGTFFTEEDIVTFSEDTDEPLTAEQAATFCDGWTWRKGLEQRMCEEGFEAISWGIGEGEHIAESPSEQGYSVWVGGGEVNNHLMTFDDAEAFAELWRADGYADTVVRAEAGSPSDAVSL